jgi:hypothetical protein
MTDPVMVYRIISVRPRAMIDLVKSAGVCISDMKENCAAANAYEKTILETAVRACVKLRSSCGHADQVDEEKPPGESDLCIPVAITVIPIARIIEIKST